MGSSCSVCFCDHSANVVSTIKLPRVAKNAAKSARSTRRSCGSRSVNEDSEISISVSWSQIGQHGVLAEAISKLAHEKVYT